ncbi:SnoaL-like protein [Streptomyces sp. Amel2xB2]|uniref:nuclear transport factor 2 family protein n=1 Tax=Streptomyces sp. Amel2xB2 TaxID=1305829 RepID=UPI000DB9A861|nr:nuclear transport factor 2 family protein [Streptomyces sp. Amel2xB2]RAJ56628.1 SnoaL-like protein [Streptomyces sp. Amel2xB2]
MTEATTDSTATEQDHRELEEWFARYDAHAAKADVEAMASMAVFPLNLVTDDAGPGTGWAGQWSREEFVRTMSEVMGGAGGEEISFESRRTPHFLSRSMAVVFTESTMTAGGQSQSMRYADVLVKQDGAWYFQTMLQSGWAGGLTGGRS